MHLRFSQELEALLQILANRPITLGDVLAQTKERGFSLVISLLVLPFLLPVPPGLTGVPGMACLLLSLQMALGRRSPWLPKRIAEFQFPNWLILNLLKNLRRLTGVLEKITQPRLKWIAQSSYAWQLNGLCITWLVILFILPIPFTNSVFAAAVLLFAVATLEADGLLMCIGYGFTIVTLVGLAQLIHTLSLSPELIQRFFSNSV